jgi:hypothetical protein
MGRENGSVDLFAIVNIKRKRIYLENWIFDKKRVYMACSEEVEYYKKIFLEALERNVVLFVEYDDERGVILQ